MRRRFHPSTTWKVSGMYKLGWARLGKDIGIVLLYITYSKQVHRIRLVQVVLIQIKQVDK